MKRFVSKRNAIIVLSVLAVLQFALLGWQWHQNNLTNSRQDQDLSSFQQELSAVNNAVSYEHVSVVPTDSKVYLPELHLALPASSVSITLAYSPDAAYVTGSYRLPTGPVNEAAVTTISAASAAQSQSVLNCSEAVRIKFEAKPNPYNPHEILATSIALTDGRTLQVYAEHIPACAKEWKLAQINPDNLAALFKQASSY